MSFKDWYWIILAIWALFGIAGIWTDDPRVRRSGSVVLIVLFIIIGFIITSGPIK